MSIDEVTEMYLKHESSHKPLALLFFIYRTSAHSSLHKAEYSAYTTSNSNNRTPQVENSWARNTSKTTWQTTSKAKQSKAKIKIAWLDYKT